MKVCRFEEPGLEKIGRDGTQVVALGWPGASLMLWYEAQLLAVCRVTDQPLEPSAHLGGI